MGSPVMVGSTIDKMKSLSGTPLPHRELGPIKMVHPHRLLDPIGFQNAIQEIPADLVDAPLEALVEG